MSTSILRPPPVDKLQPQDANEGSVQRATVPSRRSAPTGFLISLGVVSVVGLGFLVTLGKEVSAPSSAAPVSVITVVPTGSVSLAPTPACVSGQGQQAVVDGLIQQGKWEQAANQAEAALSTTTLCTDDIRPLTQRAVSSGLHVLYNQEFDPLDSAGQQQEIDRFLQLRERARLLHLEFPTLLQVARESYRTSQHRLTVAALESAFTEGTFTPSLDRDTLKLYISALYGLGYWYTQAPKNSALYAEGLAYLAASHRLAVLFHTGQGEAAARLKQCTGTEATPSSPSYQSPLFVGTP